MKKIFLFLLSSSWAIAQIGTCYVNGVTTGCPCVAGQNPCQQQFIIDWTTSYLTLLAGSNNSTAIPVSTEVPMMAVEFREFDGSNCNNNSAIYSTAIARTSSIGLNAYIDNAIGNAAQIGQGVSVMIFNPDPLFYSAAPQYTGSITPTAINTCQLTVDLAAVQHAVSKGLKIYISPEPGQSTYTACGLTVGSITLLQLESCLGPLEQAIIAYYNANGITISLDNAIHEPTGSFQNNSGVLLSTTDWTSLSSYLCAQIYAINSTVPCGVGFTDSDGTYITYYLNNFGAHVTTFDYETYGPSNAANYSYMMNSIKNYITTATSKGLKSYNTESSPPRNVPYSGSASEADVYPGMGCANQNLQTFGVNQTYAQVDCKYLSNAGSSSCTLFPTEGLAGFDPTASNNCFGSSGSAEYVMQNSTGPTAAQVSWNQGATWTGNSGVNLSKVTFLNVVIK